MCAANDVSDVTQRDKQTRTAEPDIASQLAHPIYLDTPMLISFLAAVDDGVAFSSEVAETVGDSRKSTGETSGEAKIPGLAALLGLSLSATGRYGRENSADQTTESKFVRQHTAASLFNRLRFRLTQSGAIKTIDAEYDPDALSLEPGDLVTISGKVEVSPLQVLVKTFQALLPFFTQSNGDLPALPNRDRQRSMTPQQAAEFEQLKEQREAAIQQREQMKETESIVSLVQNDIDASPVVDLVLRSEAMSVLITANRENFSDDVSAALLGGTFRLIGKVTAVNNSVDAETDVIRRGAMGAIARGAVLPLLQLADSSGSGLALDVPEPTIRGRHLQVIPLAIYV